MDTAVTFHHIYKVLIVATDIAGRAPMRINVVIDGVCRMLLVPSLRRARCGAAILQQLRQSHHLERYTARCKPMLDYFRMFEQSCARFPSFSNEIQGVYAEQVEGRTRLFTYVIKE